MLRLGNTLNNLKVFGLRAGSPIAITSRPIIDPRTLQIIGFWIYSKRKKKETRVLLTNDIRDIDSHGIIIDDYEDIVEADELVRFKEILEIDFEIEGKKIVTESGKKIGIVEDYAINNTLQIIRLDVKRSVLTNPLDSHLIINRNQIVKINDKKIIVEDLTSKATATVMNSSPAG